jgi:hypothetical protein
MDYKQKNCPSLIVQIKNKSIYKFKNNKKMKVRIFFTIIAGCFLFAASCAKDPPPKLGTDDPPTNPTNPTDTGEVITTPHDSVLPSYIEKWILMYSRVQSGCGIIYDTEYPPPEDYFGEDAMHITLNWLDSTYTSFSTTNVCWVSLDDPLLSGNFSFTTNVINSSYAVHSIIFENGVSMADPETLRWHFFDPDPYTPHWIPNYMAKYNVPRQWLCLESKYHNGYIVQLYFFRINPQNTQQNLKTNNLTINNLKSIKNEKEKYLSKIN